LASGVVSVGVVEAGSAAFANGFILLKKEDTRFKSPGG
jgi:hypothetical protein